MVDYFMTLLQH